jgi:hypothetical protein
MARSSVQYKPLYANKTLSDHQAFLDGNAGVLDRAAIIQFICAVFTTRSSALRSVNIDRLDPKAVSEHILIPRQKLYTFILYNWIRFIFIPAVGEDIAGKILIFGIGRIFSSYNDTGIQHCTDADIDFVADNSLSKDNLVLLKTYVSIFKREIAENFNILVEVNPVFTVLTVAEIERMIQSNDPSISQSAVNFYKCNESGMFVLHENKRIRESVFSTARKYPNSLFFTYFIGINISKPNVLRIYSGDSELPLISVKQSYKQSTSSVIGSKKFKITARRLSTLHEDIFPGEWYFSTKFSVNRIYDYISAMNRVGYSLNEIGFTGVDDADYRFICAAHSFMLYLQEVTYHKLDSFNDEMNDYTYMSSDRFEKFVKISGDAFFRDFDEYIIKGGLLKERQRKQYIRLRNCILQNNRDRVIDGNTEFVSRLAQEHKLHHDVDHMDNTRVKICIQYTWADIGYFVFDSISDRVIAIIRDKFIPPLTSFGITDTEITAYRRMFS